jgi:hypothetical protein
MRDPKKREAAAKQHAALITKAQRMQDLFGSSSGQHYKQRAKYQVESTFHEPIGLLGTKIKGISATF